MKANRAILLTLLAVSTFPIRALAVDTVEPFAPGASDFELYAGCEGLGQGLSALSFTEDAVLGYGLTERLSASLNGWVASDRRHRVEAQGMSAGLYGTVLDSPMLDLDLFLAWGMVDDTAARTEFVTGFELNLDSSRSGLFFTAFETLSARATASRDGVTANTRRTWLTELGLGGYLDIAEAHQLLMLLDSSLEHVPEPGGSVTDAVGLAFGYNVMVNDSIELISELGADVPTGDLPLAFAASTGLLATLP